MEKPRSPRETPLRRRLDGFRFVLERLIMRGLPYRLLIAAVIIVTIALIAGALVVLLDDDVSSLSGAVWWAFLRLTDPGYLGDDQGVVGRSVSTVVTVLGYILFLGLLIAILTQWLNETIRKLESGLTPVRLSGHVIILGWTHRTPVIIEELLHTNMRAKRFLAHHGVRELRVVILAEHVDVALLRELRERLDEVWNDRQVLLRSGSALRFEHLERVAYQDAAVIVLPGADFAERRPEAVDAQTVKTLMSISRNADVSGSRPPQAVAALSEANKADVARRAYGGACETVAADEIISRLIVQSVRQHGIWSVFSELLTLNVGNAIYLQTFEAVGRTSFGALRRGFSKAILLGVIPSGGRQPVLNPGPDRVVDPGELLVFVARGYDDCKARGTACASASESPQRSPRPALERRRRVLFLGWSRKLPAILRVLEEYGDAFEADVLSSVPLEERTRSLSRYAYRTPSEHIRQIETGYTAPGALEALEPAHYDNIVLLASERSASQDQADAATVLGYQLLSALLPEHGERPQLLVELLDEENRFLFPAEQDDVIVSPTVVSYLLSQVALRPELAAVFSELSRPWGPQIVLQRAEIYGAGNTSVRFVDIARAAEARGEIALGLRRPGAGEDQLALNPDRESQWTLRPGDEVVVLASYAEPKRTG